MKIKTANVGSIDTVFHAKGIDVEYCYKPIEGMSNRKAARWYKTHHDGDTIWIDGTVSITSNDFVRFVEDELGDYDFMVADHEERSTLGEEYDYVMDLTPRDQYLNVRYKDEDWASEREAFKDALDAKLVNSRFFAYRHRAKALMDEWWDLIDKYTVFDQSQLSYLLHVRDYKWRTITWDELEKYCIRHPHAKMI